MTRHLPQGPSGRRIIFAVDGRTDAMWTGKDRSEAVLGGNKCILNLDVASVDPDPVYEAIEAAGLATPGILVLSPFDDTAYCPAEDAIERYAKDKAHLIAELCDILGARRFRFERLFKKELKQEQGGKGGGGGASLKGEVEIKQEHGDSLFAKLQMAEELERRSPDVTAASQFLAEHHLGHDTHLLSLVRRFNHGSQLRKQEVRASLTTETTRAVQGALRVQSVVHHSLQGNLTSARSSLAQYDVQFEVEF